MLILQNNFTRFSTKKRVKKSEMMNNHPFHGKGIIHSVKVLYLSQNKIKRNSFKPYKVEFKAFL